MKKDYSKLLWGLVIVAIGIIFSGNVLDLWDINLFFSGWWTLFIIIPALISLIKNGFSWWASLLLVVGLVLLGDSLDLINSRIIWRLILPLFIIAIGISIIVSFFRGSDHDKEEKASIEFETDFNSNEYEKKEKSAKYDSSEYPNYSVIFSSKDFIITNDSLKGIRVESIFAGVVIDLREVHLTNDITINIDNVFAGLDIYVPESAQVQIVSGTPILGDCVYRENKNIDGAPKIKVKYTSIFGGIKIK